MSTYQSDYLVKLGRLIDKREQPPATGGLPSQTDTQPVSELPPRQVQTTTEEVTGQEQTTVEKQLTLEGGPVTQEEVKQGVKQEVKESTLEGSMAQETAPTIEQQKADIEKRSQEKLEKPYKTFNDGSGTMVTVTSETTEKEGIKKTKFKTQTTNTKGEPRTQNNKGYNTFEEAVENLEINLESEENETALELVEALKESQNK